MHRPSVLRDTLPMRTGWVFLALAVASATACSGTSTSAAPPTRMCGKTLYNGALGLVTFDLWGKTSATPPPAPPASDPVPIQRAFTGALVRVAPTCSRGAALVIRPSAGLVVVNRVLAKDGRPVALALRGGTPGPATLAATVGTKTQVIYFAVAR